MGTHGAGISSLTHQINKYFIFTPACRQAGVHIKRMTHLKEGDMAPLFSGRDQNGKTISLEDYRGRKVVLYFYPEDDTPTCTVQACNLRDNYSSLKRKGYVILGVSPDDEKKHKKFEKKFHLPFTLISDPEHAIIDQYGVWGEKQLYGRNYMGLHRTTFLVDEKGVIRKIFLRPKNKEHAEEIIEAWKAVDS
ncbi:MAG TPA: thioredoxin-dependent thiol peroxidase [Puia sp.]|nr:thioredoxin-dependent thiol peroxidase [Puia sp.]